MGIRISFHIPRDSLSLKEMIESTYPEFRDWYINTHEESFVEYNETLGSPQFIQFLESSATLPEFSTLTQKQVDELVSEFLGSYCDYGPATKLKKHVGPEISPSGYKVSSSLIEKHTHEETQRIWNFLFTGRSLKNDSPFIPDDTGCLYRLLEFCGN